MELAVGQYMGLRSPDGASIYRFQNFWSDYETYKDVKLTIPLGSGTASVKHEFLPFTFSGISIDRQGDLREASLILPNNSLTIGWVDTIVINRWYITVRTVLMNSTTTPSDAASQILFTYVGVATGATWDDTTVNVTVSSVLDAVGSDVPTRRVTRSVVGSIPLTAGVRLS